MHFQQKDVYTINDLLEIMVLLRSPGGCPWDREQTHRSIRNNFLEETYEAVEAIDREDRDLLKEELGDVLLQVVFHARLEEEKGSFNFADVVDGVVRKLVERHPHVFGTATAADGEEAYASWEEVKKRSHGRTTDSQTLESVSKTLPALMRAQRVQKKAAKARKMDETLPGALFQLEDAAGKLKQAADSGKTAECAGKVGKLLFSAVAVSRLLGVESEQALADSCDHFIAEFREAEEQPERK